MLDERSTAVQRQLAEQAAADANATGVEKIVGDLWATGMDEAKIEAQGIKPLEVAPGRDRRADRQPTSIADYLRDHRSEGRRHAVRLRPRGRLQGLVDQHRLRHAGRPRPAGSRTTTSTPTRSRQAATLTKSTSPRCSNCPASPAADAAKQAKDVMAFETRLAKVSKSSEELRATSRCTTTRSRRPTPTS